MEPRRAHYPIVDAPGLVHPTQAGGIPIVIGGSGKRRTPALAARYASEFNAAFDSVETSGELFTRVRAACEDHRRDPDDLTLSVAQVLCLGNDEATLRRRAAAISREVDELRSNGLAGSTDEIVDRIGRFTEVGATRFYLQVLDLHDLEQIEEFAATVVPQL